MTATNETLRAALATMAETFANVCETHIYGTRNGGIHPKDCAYCAALDRADKALLHRGEPDTAPLAVAEHTPGPWHIGARVGSDAYIWGPDRNQRGCIARVNLYSVDQIDKARRECNARLIAAAPGLLAALEECVDRIYEVGDQPPPEARAILDRVYGPRDLDGGPYGAAEDVPADAAGRRG